MSVLRLVDYNMNPGLEQLGAGVPPPAADAPKSPTPTAPWMSRPQQSDQQHMANFDQLWKINPAFAFEYGRMVDDQGGWFQRSMGDLRNRYAGGNASAFNGMLNDSSYGIQNALAGYSGGRDAALQMIMDKVNSRNTADLNQFNPNAPVMQYRLPWDNPYNNGGGYGGLPNSPFTPGAKNPYSLMEQVKGPGQFSATPPPMPGQAGWDPNGGVVTQAPISSAPRDPNAPPVAPQPGLPVNPVSNIPPASTANPYSRPQTKSMSFGGTNTSGAGGWNPYQGWRQ